MKDSFSGIERQVAGRLEKLRGFMSVGLENWLTVEMLSKALRKNVRSKYGNILNFQLE
jgi:hypothetical protein